MLYANGVLLSKHCFPTLRGGYASGPSQMQNKKYKEKNREPNRLLCVCVYVYMGGGGLWPLDVGTGSPTPSLPARAR